MIFKSGCEVWSDLNLQLPEAFYIYLSVIELL